MKRKEIINSKEYIEETIGIKLSQLIEEDIDDISSMTIGEYVSLALKHGKRVNVNLEDIEISDINENFEEFQNSFFPYFKTQLHHFVEEIQICSDAIKNLFFVLVDWLLYCGLGNETGEIKFSVHYEWCVFCHVSRFDDEIQRITGIAITEDKVVYLEVEDKDYPEKFEREYVDMSETDFDYAHLMQLVIDYIENIL